MEVHYSGENSEEFWRRINELPPAYWKAHDKLYDMGVKLQNLEGDVLKELEAVYNRISNNALPKHSAGMPRPSPKRDAEPMCVCGHPKNKHDPEDGDCETHSYIGIGKCRKCMCNKFKARRGRGKV